MSYSLYLQVFKEQKTSTISLEDLSTVINKYGAVERDQYGLQIVPTVSDLFGSASLIEETENAISAIVIERPYDYQSLAELIFELLKFQGTCLFDQSVSFIITRHEMKRDLPDDLLTCTQGKVGIVNSADQCWPINR